jgi:hypothetical protein
MSNILFGSHPCAPSCSASSLRPRGRRASTHSLTCARSSVAGAPPRSAQGARGAPGRTRGYQQGGRQRVRQWSARSRFALTSTMPSNSRHGGRGRSRGGNLKASESGRWRPRCAELLACTGASGGRAISMVLARAIPSGTAGPGRREPRDFEQRCGASVIGARRRGRSVRNALRSCAHRPQI